jgi:hypothetical protein
MHLGHAPSVIWLPSEASDQATAAAIAEHRRGTGWVGPVIPAPLEMSKSEWIARHGAG